MTAARHSPANSQVWPRILTGVGWLIMGVGTVLTLIHAWRMIGSDMDWSLVMPMDIAFATIAIACGHTFIVIAKSARPGAAEGRWRLWAKVLLDLGAILSFGIPAFVYGALYFATQVVEMNEPDVSRQVGLAFHPWRLEWTALIGGTPFTIGLALIIPALIWGRRKSQPDIPAVFS